MVTLVSVTHGGSTRRCDARCYGAKRPKCRCICGGKHHGAGLDKAVAMVREEAQKLICTEAVPSEYDLVPV